MKKTPPEHHILSQKVDILGALHRFEAPCQLQWRASSFAQPLRWHPLHQQ